MGKDKEYFHGYQRTVYAEMKTGLLAGNGASELGL